VDCAAIYVTAQQHHQRPMSVIRPQAGVLTSPATELGHHEQREAPKLLGKVVEGGAQSLSQSPRQVRHQSVAPTLGEVHVPVAQVDCSDLQNYVGFYQQGDLLQPRTELGWRVSTPVRRQVGGGVQVLERLQQPQRFPPDLRVGRLIHDT